MTPADFSDDDFELFEAYLDEAQAPGAQPFEDWVKVHPERADALRAIWEDWQRADAGLLAIPETVPTVAYKAGDTIGDFLLVRALGRGGQEVVWEAEEQQLGRRVALKLLRADRVGDRDQLLFEREAKAGARIRHEGIVAVYSFGRDGEIAWIAQELVPGGRSLRDRINEVRNGVDEFSEWYRECAETVARIAEAVEVAHEAGIIHRDLKPQNVLLDEAGYPKVGDFGLARVEDVSAMSGQGDLIGTYLYMSPEQVAANQAQIDHRSDVFSLDVVFYELLTMTRPFEGDTAMQICARIVDRDPVEPRIVRSRIPRDLSVICCKALEKNPERRYASMEDFAEDVRRSLNNEPILARAPGPILRARKWVARHPAISSAGAIALVSFVILSWLFLVSKRRAENVLRLSTLRDVQAALVDIEALHPALPENEQGLVDWIERARGLTDQLPDFVAMRDRLALEADARQVAVDEDAQAMTWVYPAGESQSQWWHTQLVRLVEELERIDRFLLDPNMVSSEFGWSATKRLEFVRSLKQRVQSEAGFLEPWRRAQSAIAESEHYNGFEMARRVDFVPLGPDPDSGLWEFAHLASGEVPVRDSEGRLQFDENSGLVFVLIPGGEAWLGVQRDTMDRFIGPARFPAWVAMRCLVWVHVIESASRDREPGLDMTQDPVGVHFDRLAKAHEGEPFKKDFEPFLLSKFEMTQSQWMRLEGENPSGHNPDDQDFDVTWIHPVETISWTSAHRVLRRIGLQFPEESCWERAARAGTTTPWWFGSEPEDLAKFDNIADRQLRLSKAGKRMWTYIEGDDGYPIHAPVNAGAPNPFGLVFVHGNLYEMCRNGIDKAVKPWGEGRWVPEEGSRTFYERRIMRGGGHLVNVESSRSSARNARPITSKSSTFGLRPALDLD